jgi:ELWxxDGT repeat protein
MRHIALSLLVIALLSMAGCTEEPEPVMPASTGTYLVADLNAGPDASNPSDFLLYGDHLYFQSADSASGSELRRYDGETIHLVADIEPGLGHGYPTMLFPYQGSL